MLKRAEHTARHKRPSSHAVQMRRAESVRPAKNRMAASRDTGKRTGLATVTSMVITHSHYSFTSLTAVRQCWLLRYNRQKGNGNEQSHLPTSRWDRYILKQLLFSHLQLSSLRLCNFPQSKMHQTMMCLHKRPWVPSIPTIFLIKKITPKQDNNNNNSSNNNNKTILKWGRDSSALRRLTDLAEDLSSVPSTHTGSPTTTWFSSSPACVYRYPPSLEGTYKLVWIQTNTQKQIKIRSFV